MTALQVIESVYEAFGRGDIPHILSLVAATGTWRQSAMLPWGGDYVGPQGAGEFFTKLAGEMETTAFKVHESIVNGNEVFSFGYYEGKSHRTGRTGGADFMFRWRVEGDKIAAYESYIDTAALLAALR